MVNSLSFFGQNTGGSAAQNTEHILYLLKLRLKLIFPLRSLRPLREIPCLFQPITHHSLIHSFLIIFSEFCDLVLNSPLLFPLCGLGGESGSLLFPHAQALSLAATL